MLRFSVGALFGFLILPMLTNQARCQTPAAAQRDANPQLFTGAGGDVAVTTAAALNSFVISSTYSKLALACAAAASSGRTLLLVSNFNAVPKQGCAANIRPAGGVITPGPMQVVTISGKIDQIPVQLFDTGGRPGSIVLTGGNQAIYPNWFGAKMDGSTDDLAAWNSAIAACPSSGCIVQMPENSVSHVSGTILTPLTIPITISGAGRSSVITGTGFPIVQLRSDGQGGQTLSDLHVYDPVGSANTIGVLVSSSGSSPNSVTLRNLLVSGVINSGSLGIGIKSIDTVILTLDNVIQNFMDTGLLLTGAIARANTVVSIQNSKINRNTTRGIDIESNGDINCAGSDIESNGVNLYLSGDAYFTSTSCHYENGTSGINLEINNGEMLSLGSGIGAVVQIDSGGHWTSIGERMSGVSVVNNSVTFAFEPGVILFYPTFGPMSVTGTGWTVSYDRLGVHEAGNRATSYSHDGAPNYKFGSAIITSNGTRFSVSTSTSGCIVSSPVGDSAGGYFTATTKGECTVTMTMGGVVAPNAWQVFSPVPNQVRYITGSSTTATFVLAGSLAGAQIFVNAVPH